MAASYYGETQGGTENTEGECSNSSLPRLSFPPKTLPSLPHFHSKKTKQKTMSELALKLITQEKEERTGKLDIGRCGLTELPEELFELVWLEELVVSNMWIETKKNDWVNSQNNEEDNVINNIPIEITKLQKLKSLKLSGDYNCH
ncbi:MAG: hypothetical protein R2788_04445 [Saprospiraceae bacterium]